MAQSDVTKKILESFDAFVFDCDGVVWKGNDSIDGVCEAIIKLKETKQVLFATNNSLHPPAGLVSKLESMGLNNVLVENVICPANVMPTVADGLTDDVEMIAVIGTPALNSGLELKFDASRIIKWTYLEKKYFPNMTGSDVMDKIGDIEFQELPAVIVLGYDSEYCYAKLAWVVRVCHLRQLNGVKTTVLKSNGDLTYPTKWGVLPGAGSICIPYENALKNFSLVTVKDCGKPEGIMAEVICQRTGIAPERIAMVGDNLLTDIQFGNDHLGCSILVKTGIHGVDDVEKLNIKPTYIIESAADLMK